MPYAKDSQISGAKETYEIVHFCVDAKKGEIQVQLEHFTFGENGIPAVELLNKVIRNFNQKIIDPNWDSSSNPPKPDQFDESDPGTWDGLTRADFPMINDSEKQHFDNLASKDITEGTLYGNIKSSLYQTLVDMGELPPISGGWDII